MILFLFFCCFTIDASNLQGGVIKSANTESESTSAEKKEYSPEIVVRFSFNIPKDERHLSQWFVIKIFVIEVCRRPVVATPLALISHNVNCKFAQLCSKVASPLQFTRLIYQYYYIVR